MNRRRALLLTVLAGGTTTTLLLQPDATAGLDTFLYSNNATANFGTDTRFFIGHDGFGVVRELVKFDLSSIPAGSAILSATLSLYLTAETSTQARNIKVYRSLRAWVEAQASWNNYITGTPWQTAGAFGANDTEQTEIASRAFSATETINEFKDFTLTASAVQEMITGGAFTNNGFFLKADVETNGAYTFASSDHATAGNRPKLTVVYYQ